MKTKTLVHAIWLALGLFQLMLMAGCGSAGPSDHLLSTANADSGTEQQSGGSSAPAPLPVRVSRAFFEKSLTGSLKINGDESQSDISWMEYPPTSPAPTGPVIADFRSHEGCASYEQLDGIQLCFTVVPDISSLGINAKEVQVKGLCNGQYQDAHFVSASSANGIVTVTFEGTCQGRTQTAELTLRQI